jgi:hypothetical protein
MKVGMLPGNFNQKSLQEISIHLAGKYIFQACLDHYTVFVLLILQKSLIILQMVILLPTQHPPQQWQTLGGGRRAIPPLGNLNDS